MRHGTVVEGRLSECIPGGLPIISGRGHPESDRGTVARNSRTFSCRATIGGCSGGLSARSSVMNFPGKMSPEDIDALAFEQLRTVAAGYEAAGYGAAGYGAAGYGADGHGAAGYGGEAAGYGGGAAGYGAPSLVVGSKAGGWANQALDYALNIDAPYIATAYMKPPPGRIYDPRAYWIVEQPHTRQALDDWYRSLVELSDRYHYLAVFDKTVPEWTRGKPVAVATSDPDAYAGRDCVAGLFDSIANVFKGAASSVASFVHHPPGLFATVIPLFTKENQRYWAQKLGGSTGAQIYDAGVKVVASQALGPQGPALVEAYNKVVEDAARGHLDAKQILAKAPQIAKLATASKQGPDAFRAAVAETKSAVKVSGSEGEWDMSANCYIGADGYPVSSDAYVGQFWPFFLGLPFGG